MRWTGVLVTCLLACALHPADGIARAGQKPTYNVSVQVSKPELLTKAKTYAWTETRPSFNPAIHERIVAAVDRELQARGLSKRTAGPSDLAVTYSSLSRTDVDVKRADRGEAFEQAIGTLILDLRDPSNNSSIFRVRVDTPLGSDSSARDATIDSAVASIFERYPRQGKR